MDIDISKEGNTITAVFDGRLDTVAAQQIANTLDPLLQQADNNNHSRLRENAVYQQFRIAHLSENQKGSGCERREDVFEECLSRCAAGLQDDQIGRHFRDC